MHEGLARSIAVTAVEIFRARLEPRGIALRPEHIKQYVVEERGFRDPDALSLIGLHVVMMVAERENKAMAMFRRPKRKRRRPSGPRPVQLDLPFLEMERAAA